MHYRIILLHQSHFRGCPGHQAGRTPGEKRLGRRHFGELGGVSRANWQAAPGYPAADPLGPGSLFSADG